MSSRHSALRLAGCSHKAAAFACRNWHYSKTVPPGKLVKIGAWEKGRFIGAVIFSCGSGASVNGTKYGFSQLWDFAELQRVALRRHEIEVSRIISIAFRLLRKTSPGLRAVVSYADPEQGHNGAIYQAGNWIYMWKNLPLINLVFKDKSGKCCIIVEPCLVQDGVQISFWANSKEGL